MAVGLSIVLGLITVGSLLASPALSGLATLPSTGWYSGHQVQNTGSTTATVAMVAYNQAATAFSCGTQSLASFKSYTFQMATDCSGFPAGQGSAVVSSDQPIVAVVNVTNRPSGGLGIAGGEAAGQYQGISGSDAATQVSFPLFKSDHVGRTTTFFLQNAGSATTNMTATYKLNAGGAPLTHVYTNIPANAMVVMTPIDAAGMPSGTGNFGSMTVTSPQPLAGSMLEAQTPGSPVPTTMQASTGLVASSFASKAFAPTNKRKFGPQTNDTGLQVQNVSGGGLTITVLVTYTIAASPIGARVGTKVSEPPAQVGDGSSKNYLSALSPLIDGELASAVIETRTASGKLVGLVSERTNTGAFRVTTYTLIPSTKVTTKVSLPLVKEQQNFNKRSGVSVQNVGTAATQVRLTYAPTDGSGPYILTTNVAIAPGAAKTFLDVCLATPSGTTWTGPSIPCNKVNGVLVESLGGQGLVVIVNESVVPGSGLSQDNANYEGFNIN